MSAIGQKVQLWGFEISLGLIRVICEVTVTVTQKLASGVQVAVEKNGTLWELHGNLWFCHAEREHPQSLIDSTEVYSGVRSLEGGADIHFVDKDGNPVFPSGDDIVYCRTHDRYWYKTALYVNHCLFCRMDEQDQQLGIA